MKFDARLGATLADEANPTPRPTEVDACVAVAEVTDFDDDIFGDDKDVDVLIERLK